MLSLLDLAERTQKGPKLPEEQWDMKLFRKISELVKKYNIKYPGSGAFINTDDDLPRRAFEAAIEFLTENGIYCVSTNRVIELTRQEILDCLRDAPTVVKMGQGSDQRFFRQQPIESKGPLNFCPGHHTPFTEDIASLVVKNFAQIPETDFIEGFNFNYVDGYEVMGEPLEVYATRRELAWMREGVRKAGRPGVAIVYYPINTRASCLIAAHDEEMGLRQNCDGILLSLLPDVKMEQSMLAAAMVTQDRGCFSLSGSFALAGGFCGGYEGAIIEGICKPIAAMICYRDYISYVGVEHVQTLSAMKMEFGTQNWARSVVCQALNRHTHTICMAWVIPTSGPGTENNLLECAIRNIEAPINGCNLYAIRHSRARINAGQTPVEAEWMVEVSNAAIKAGLTRESGAEVIKAIAKKLEGRQPERGYTIQECYDLVHHKPLPEYEAIHQDVKRQLRELGLPLN